jgi:hypothetical protein
MLPIRSDEVLSERVRAADIQVGDILWAAQAPTVGVDRLYAEITKVRVGPHRTAMMARLTVEGAEEFFLGWEPNDAMFRKVITWLT